MPASFRKRLERALRSVTPDNIAVKLQFTDPNLITLTFESRDEEVARTAVGAFTEVFTRLQCDLVRASGAVSPNSPLIKKGTPTH